MGWKTPFPGGGAECFAATGQTWYAASNRRICSGDRRQPEAAQFSSVRATLLVLGMVITPSRDVTQFRATWAGVLPTSLGRLFQFPEAAVGAQTRLHRQGAVGQGRVGDNRHVVLLAVG